MGAGATVEEEVLVINALSFALMSVETAMFFVSGGGGGGGYNQMIHENQNISYVLLRNATAPHHSCILYIKNSFRKRMMAYAS